jgi:hypothetical protein
MPTDHVVEVDVVVVVPVLPPGLLLALAELLPLPLIRAAAMARSAVPPIMAATVEPDWACCTPAGFPGARRPSVLDAAKALVETKPTANKAAHMLRIDVSPSQSYFVAR